MFIPSHLLKIYKIVHKIMLLCYIHIQDCFLYPFVLFNTMSYYPLVCVAGVLCCILHYIVVVVIMSIVIPLMISGSNNQAKILISMLN